MRNKIVTEDIELFELTLTEDFDKMICDKQTIDKINQLLLKKDDRTQKLLALRGQGYSFAEISGELNITESSARVIFHRVKKWLMENLERNELL
jgi:RNA polymerase sigma-70 factor (ECF subfamily)